ncbi:MAG: PEGA domain-containing protein [Persicimonas sp.]
MAACLMVALCGCTAVERIPDEKEAYLRMEVEPGSTKIYVDSDYQGVVERWTGSIVPIEPGARRVELRKEGYITRRFDVELAAGEQMALTVDMERKLESFEEERKLESFEEE